jgi:hypothetical protein
LIRAIEKAIGDAVSLIGTVVIVFLAITLKIGLTFSKIFVALEIMNSLKYYMACTVKGIGLFY